MNRFYWNFVALLVNASTNFSRDLIIFNAPKRQYFYSIFSSISGLFLFIKLLIVRISTQITPFKSLKMKYITWNFGHTLKYDSKTPKKVWYFLHFHKNLIFTYGQQNFFSCIPDENIVVVTKKPPMCQIMRFSL